MNSDTQTNQDGVESQVIDELLETLEDGRLGFIDAAEKLAAAGRPQWADTFGALAAQRAAMADNCNRLHVTTGSTLTTTGAVRSWPGSTVGG